MKVGNWSVSNRGNWTALSALGIYELTISWGVAPGLHDPRRWRSLQQGWRMANQSRSRSLKGRAPTARTHVSPGQRPGILTENRPALKARLNEWSRREPNDIDEARRVSERGASESIEDDDSRLQRSHSGPTKSRALPWAYVIRAVGAKWSQGRRRSFDQRAAIPNRQPNQNGPARAG
jgi:hypothetical protein